MLTGRLRELDGAAGSRARFPPGSALREPSRCSRSSTRSRSSPTSSRGWRPRQRRDRLARAPRRVRRGRGVGARRAGSRAGVTRIVTIGTGIDSCRAALEIADAHDGVYAALGIDPASGGNAPRRGGSDELRELLAHPKAVAVGETGLDTVRSTRRREQQRRLLDAHLELADELEPSGRHPQPRGGRARRHARSSRSRGTVVLHCFSSPELAAASLSSAGYYVSFAGNVTYPNAVALRDAAAAVPRDRILVETDSPYLAPQPRPRQRRTSRRTSFTRIACSGGGPRREPSRSSPPRRTPTPPRRSRSRERRAEEGARSALPRRREHPRSHRAAECARRRTTSSSRSVLASASSRVTSRITCGSSTRSSSIARSSRRFATPSARGRTSTLVWGDALDVDIGALSADAGEARGEPPVQHRHAARRRDARARRLAASLVRDGAARGRGSVLRRAADEGVRRRLRARPAHRPEDRLPSRPADGVPSAAACRVGSRRVRARADRADRRGQSGRRGRLRTPPQDARELARDLAGFASRDAGRGGPARDRVTRRTRAPRSSSRRSSCGSRTFLR